MNITDICRIVMKNILNFKLASNKEREKSHKSMTFSTVGTLDPLDHLSVFVM